MDKITLAATSRDVEKSKAKELRRAGIAPACVYGAGKENVNVGVNRNDFVRLFRTAGNNTVVELSIDEKESENVLIYSVSYHPVSDEVDHIDFIRVRMDEKITTKVPLEFVGLSKAVKDLGGIFNTDMDEIEVTCLPGDLPKLIEVNIDSLLTFDDAIKISDLNIPAGVEVEHEAEIVVANVIPPRSEEELASLDQEVSENVEGVEVEEKGKKEEEGAEGAEGEKTENKGDKK